MYRPQFSYPTPAGFQDRDFVYYFDYLNTPLLNNATLAAGALVQNIPLVTQQDSPFSWRGVKIQGANGTDPVVDVQFKDPFGNLQSSDFVPIDLYRKPSGASIYGFTPVLMEPCVDMPQGAVILLSVKNQTGSAQDLTKVRICILGTKRNVEKRRVC